MVLFCVSRGGMLVGVCACTHEDWSISVPGEIDLDEFRLGIIREAFEEIAIRDRDECRVGNANLSQLLKRMSIEVNAHISRIVSHVLRAYKAAPY